MEPEDEVSVLGPGQWHISLPNYTTWNPDTIFVISMERPANPPVRNPPNEAHEGIPMPIRAPPGAKKEQQPAKRQLEEEPTNAGRGNQNTIATSSSSSQPQVWNHAGEEEWERCD